MNQYLPAPSPVEPPPAHPTILHSRAADCRICLGPHDDEIHAATLSVRRWFREEVTKGFDVPGLISA